MMVCILAVLSHEKSLIRSIKGSMHTFLYGKSGNGKSWLYKRTLSEAKLNYVVVNCANASRKGSITNEIVSVCNRSAKPQETEVVKTQKLGASFVGKAEITHQTKYKPQVEDSLLEAFREVSVSKSKTIIVLDNVNNAL